MERPGHQAIEGHKRAPQNPLLGGVAEGRGGFLRSPLSNELENEGYGVCLRLVFVVGPRSQAERRFRSTDIPKFDPENPKARGIILSFHHWPDEEEAAEILQKTTAAGLNKMREIERFKTWVFEWPKLREGIKAQEVCDSLPQLSSLAYCEPDYLLDPAGPVG